MQTMRNKKSILKVLVLGPFLSPNAQFTMMRFWSKEMNKRGLEIKNFQVMPAVGSFQRKPLPPALPPERWL